MTCKECGHENNDNSKFCAICGAKLDAAMEVHQSGMCTACDFKNTPDCMYCGGCGVELRPQGNQHRRMHGHHQEQSKRKARRVERPSTFRPYTVGFFVVGVSVLLFLALDSKSYVGEQERSLPVVEARSADPALEIKVIEVASKFICSCGSCGEQSLDVCSCETAVQERQFIRTSLQSGQSLDKVALAVRDQFGWVKPAFSAKLDSLARKSGRRVKTTSVSGMANAGELRIPDKKEIGFPEFPLSQSGTTKLATAADRLEIFSNFKCPCRQCGIEELKDCSCNHPRGAKEVKAFVDANIAEGKYTVAQVVNEVELKYGGKKF